MAKINVLDSSVYNLIAAGEVVERPASVVKELVENSIDAGATYIKIEIIDGGITEIRITDNGCGIEKEYLVNAFLPHATSKIEKASDLDNIFTLGFRGEALASIASVSNVRLTSKVASEELGNSIVLSAGNIVSQNSVGANDGTTIVVSNLFFNVPARAKFLKKPKSEEQEITNIVERFILANPSLNITYIADGKQVLYSNGGTLKDAIYAVYGKQSLNELLEINAQRDGLKVYGYIGRPSFSKANRTYQTIVINGRYVQNTTIATAVTNAYGEMLMKRKYPFFVLSFDIDPTTVDVNVHPNKMEVRFENSGKIFSCVYDAASRALSEMDYVLEVDTQTGEVIKTQGTMQIAEVSETPKIIEKPTHHSAASFFTPQSSSKQVDKAGVDLSHLKHFSLQEEQKVSNNMEQEILQSKIDFSSQNTVAADGFGMGSKLLEKLTAATNSYNPYKSEQQELDTTEITTSAAKVVGKLFNTYIIVEFDGAMYLIDQHAAHERVLYEKFKREVDTNKLIVQPLMFPYILNVNAAEYNIIEDSISSIRELGFDIDYFGDKTYKISSIPMLLFGMNLSDFFAGFLAETKGGLQITKSELIKDKLMQHSCKSAIKGGNDLSKSEIENLFTLMNEEKIPLFCPHGRPIAVKVSKTEIEKWFKRIV